MFSFFVDTVCSCFLDGQMRVGDVVIASTGPEARPFPALKALDISEVTKTAADTAVSFYFLG